MSAITKGGTDLTEFRAVELKILKELLKQRHKKQSRNTKKFSTSLCCYNTFGQCNSKLYFIKICKIII